MINVHGIRRNVKNVVRNYSIAQVKVREATSNDPWGPSSTLMSEIADLTYNVVAFSEIMQMIWKRLNDHGRNWRHVYKALVLLEYLIKTGSEKVGQQCKENIFAIQTLKDFQYVEENKDQGMNVREKSKQLVSLLKDDERLKNERGRALKAKERFAQAASHAAGDLKGQNDSSGGRDSYGSSPDGSTSPRELECARPQTAGEEELQLQLALAMSKEEAKQEEQMRRNDDLRLQMAITESEEDFKRAQPKESNLTDGDFLGLNVATCDLSKPPHPATDPWGMPLNATNAVNQETDPWMVPSTLQSQEMSVKCDPWSNPVSNPSVQNDPWMPKLSTSASVSFEVLGSRTTNGDMDEFDLINKRSTMSSPDTTGRQTASPNPFNVSDFKSSKPHESYHSPNPSRKTPESFLGANSNLVNLEALVSSKPPSQDATATTNPFAPPPVFNPFHANKPPPPTINQLRGESQFTTFQAESAVPISSTVLPAPILPTDKEDFQTSHNPFL